MHKSLEFNGMRKSWLYLLEGKNKSPYAPVNNNLVRINRRRGAVLTGSQSDVLYIIQPVGFIAVSDEDAQNKLDDLKSWLITSKEKELLFDDDPNRYYLAKIDGDFENFSKVARKQYSGILTFIVPEGISYGQEKPLTFPSSGILTLENEGTAETEPIIELTAKDKATFAMVANSEGEYNLIGKPADVDEVIVDEKTQLFYEDGTTIDDWITSGTSIDGGEMSGNFGSDGAGITAPNYGSGNRWHGPVAMKEVTPAQDFEVEAHLQLRTSVKNQTSRVEVYLFDENMKVLGKMAVMDNATNQFVKKGEARIGPFLGRDINYLISSANYQYAWDYFFGMLRIRRVGNEIEFYITRIDTSTKHVYSLKKIFRDASGEFNGKLKYVQIHIGTFGAGPRAYSAKFFSVSAHELNKATVDQTPYIIDVGDVVTFDHKTKDILLNGESRKDLKNFGGSFFDLEKGTNTLTVSPEGVFDAEVTHRDKYL